MACGGFCNVTNIESMTDEDKKRCIENGDDITKRFGADGERRGMMKLNLKREENFLN